MKETWTAVDRYITDLLVPADQALDAALEASAAVGLPSINVSPNQGKLLWLLAKLGGARVILATVTDGKAMGSVMGGLGANGTLMVLGAPGSLEVSPYLLISGKRSVKGWYSGTSIDSQDALAFSVLEGVRSQNEVFPMERAAEAYERMMSGKARFRVVLTMGK